VSGSFTVYCPSCAQPILLRRRGAEWTVSDSKIIRNRDGSADAVRCICGAIWERESTAASPMVR
jgi:hypothetical protein